jgi:hypothetical protein
MNRLSFDDLKATVERMEQRFDSDPSLSDLMAAYHMVSLRFRDDLANDREVLLSRGAALMLIQQIAAGTPLPRDET